MQERMAELETVTSKVRQLVSYAKEMPPLGVNAWEISTPACGPSIQGSRAAYQMPGGTQRNTDAWLWWGQDVNEFKKLYLSELLCEVMVPFFYLPLTALPTPLQHSQPKNPPAPHGVPPFLLSYLLFLFLPPSPPPPPSSPTSSTLLFLFVLLPLPPSSGCRQLHGGGDRQVRLRGHR